MDKSLDLKFIELKEKLIETINESHLPLTCIGYAVGEISQLIAITLEQQIAKEREKLSKESEEHECQ